MPLPNGVDPSGRIHATCPSASGLGNRGILHDEAKHIVRPWDRKAWVTCELRYKGRKREFMSSRQYTELFFLGEATAFAAGHRPCGECRRGAMHGVQAGLGSGQWRAAEWQRQANHRHRHRQRTARGPGWLGLNPGRCATCGDPCRERSLQPSALFFASQMFLGTAESQGRRAKPNDRLRPQPVIRGWIGNFRLADVERPMSRSAPTASSRMNRVTGSPHRHGARGLAAP